MTPQILTARAELLLKGEHIVLEENTVMNNKHLTFSCDIKSLNEGEKIVFGHGETEYAASYIEIDATHVRVFEHTAETSKRAEYEHGLRIEEYINVSLDTGFGDAFLTVGTSTGTYKSPKFPWLGRNGMIFAFGTSEKLENVTLNWYCGDYKKDVWLFGDSYFNACSEARWTSYLIKDGHTEHLMVGFPGMGSRTAIRDFKLALSHAVPKYAVWCMGMNDPDNEESINEDYLASCEEFLKLCAENGIVPVFSTIPNVPQRINGYKNAWVKSSGFRFIDFSRAVGGNALGSAWYDGMLDADMVHPTPLGAKALYAQFLVDFPEI